MEWVTNAMAPKDPPAASQPEQSHCALLHEGLGGPASPNPVHLPRAWAVLSAKLYHPCSGRRMCWDLMNFTPTFQHCFFSPFPKKKPHSSLWGSEGDGEGSTGVSDPWQRGRATEKSPIQSSPLFVFWGFFCKWFSRTGIFGDTVPLPGSQKIQSSITQ